MLILNTLRGVSVSGHKKLSYIKSALRLVGCGVPALAYWGTMAGWAFAFLFVAEIVGIVEEEFE